MLPSENQQLKHTHLLSVGMQINPVLFLEKEAGFFYKVLKNILGVKTLNLLFL